MEKGIFYLGNFFLTKKNTNIQFQGSHCLRDWSPQRPDQNRYPLLGHPGFGFHSRRCSAAISGPGRFPGPLQLRKNHGHLPVHAAPETTGWVDPMSAEQKVPTRREAMGSAKNIGALRIASCRLARFRASLGRHGGIFSTFG